MIKQNGFVIYPNEVKYFTTCINLPLRLPYEGNPWLSNVKSSEDYEAELLLINIATETKKYLTEDLRKEIEKNRYILFDGMVKSNRVPVKKISMPEIKE